MFWPLMSGLTAATFQSSRNLPVVRDWFVIVVMASAIVSLNFNRNLVLQGTMMEVVGFICLIMLSISFLSIGRKELHLVHFLWYIFTVSTSWNCSLIFLILFKKKSTNLSGRSDGELVSGIGFASFGFVSDLRILYRFVALFSVSFNLLSICIFLEWCRCYSYIVLICLYSIRSSCCLDLIHLLSANLLWVLSLCASWSNHGSWSFLISS